MQPELVLAAGAELGEGPVWEPRTGSLYWVDILAGELHTFDPRTGLDRCRRFDEPVGCLAPDRQGGLVLALGTSFVRLRSPDGEPERLLQVEPPGGGTRFNDGKCDPQGRFLAGTMDREERSGRGSLYSYSADGSCRVLLSGLGISNGLTWSPDGATFYFIDTPTRTVMAYDYDRPAGTIANGRPVISVPPLLGWPDGMTGDAEGCLWVALWGGAALTRWEPRSGRLLEAVRFPVSQVTCPVFGGPALDELYVTTAWRGLDEAERAGQPQAGGLFRVKVDVPGLPPVPFAG